MRKFYSDLDGKNPNLECLFVHRKQGLLLSVYVDDIQMAGKKQNITPMWKILMKNVDLQRQDSAIHDLCLKMVTHLQRQGNTIVVFACQTLMGKLPQGHDTKDES